MVEIGKVGLVFNSYGGKLAEIPDNATPFPHRAGILFKIQYSVSWAESGEEAENQFLTQARDLHTFMTPFVSSNPRQAYLNYRDVDIGTTDNGPKRYEQAKVFGAMYFKNNFDRLVKVKTAVDPDNFFRNEQSIPPLDMNFNLDSNFSKISSFKIDINKGKADTFTFNFDFKEFLSKGGVMILATWLSQAATEEQTSVLHHIIKVLCHLSLHKALPAHMSAILQSVNKLRFYRTSDGSEHVEPLRNRLSQIKWSKKVLNCYQRLVKDFVKILNQVSSEEVPTDLKLPDSFSQLVSEMKNNKHNAKEFVLILKGMTKAGDAAKGGKE
nr:berberine bridge enzyme-like 21 [Ipomoea trifida]